MKISDFRFIFKYLAENNIVQYPFQSQVNTKEINCEVVLQDFELFIEECKQCCLWINGFKCELNVNFQWHERWNHDSFSAFHEVTPDIKIVNEDELTLLGYLLTALAVKSMLSTKVDMHHYLSDSLESIHPHTSLYLLKNCRCSS